MTNNHGIIREKVLKVYNTGRSTTNDKKRGSWVVTIPKEYINQFTPPEGDIYLRFAWNQRGTITIKPVHMEYATTADTTADDEALDE